MEVIYFIYLSRHTDIITILISCIYYSFMVILSTNISSKDSSMVTVISQFLVKMSSFAGSSLTSVKSSILTGRACVVALVAVIVFKSGFRFSTFDTPDAYLAGSETLRLVIKLNNLTITCDRQQVNASLTCSSIFKEAFNKPSDLKCHRQGYSRRCDSRSAVIKNRNA